MTTSVPGSTVVLSDAQSLAGLRSTPVKLTQAVLVLVPTWFSWTPMVKVTASPASMVPIVQVTVPPDSVQGTDAWMKVAPAGSVSLTNTSVAPVGPLLVTTMV